MTIGQNMQAIRERKGISRVHLSCITGVNVRTIKNMELDAHSPGLYNVMECAKALSVSLDEYVGWGRFNG